MRIIPWGPHLVLLSGTRHAANDDSDEDVAHDEVREENEDDGKDPTSLQTARVQFILHTCPALHLQWANQSSVQREIAQAVR